jgi:hypothetical protein
MHIAKYRFQYVSSQYMVLFPAGLQCFQNRSSIFPYTVHFNDKGDQLCIVGVLKRFHCRFVAVKNNENSGFGGLMKIPLANVKRPRHIH